MKMRLAPDQNLNYDSKIVVTLMMCSGADPYLSISDDCHLHCCCAGTGLFDFTVAGGL